MKNWKSFDPKQLSLSRENLYCKDKNKIVAACHDGIFHADDVFSAALLSLLWDDFDVCRTRIIHEITSADIVFDVGRIHDGKKFFDHHQNEDEDPSIVAANGVKHCAFTLLVEKIITDPEIREKFQEKVGYPIAVRDNGQIEMFEKYPQSVGVWVHSMNPTWDEESSGTNIAFKRSVRIATYIIIRELENIRAAIAARSVVNQIISTNKNSQVLVLNEYIPYDEVLDEYPNILFVVFRQTDKDQWILQAVPKNSKNKFDSRMLLPKQWRGYNEETDYFDERYRDFIEEFGFKCIFVHKTGFTSVWNTRSDAIQAAQFAIKAANYT